MRPKTDRQARALRAVAASALTTLFAATAHTLGGGGAPAPMVLLIAILLSMPIALALTGRRARRVRTGLTVVGSQAVYHLVFAVFGMSAAFAGPMAHVHGAMPGPATIPAAAGDAAPMMGLFEPAMLTMHAAAAAATVVILLWGERLLRTVARMLWPARLRRVFRPITARAAAVVEGRLPSVVIRARLTGLRRRGPPVTA